MEVQGELRTADFAYQFRSGGNTYCLNVPLELPFEGHTRELAVRLVRAHRIPCHLEDDLCEKLGAFASSASLEMLDQLAERNLYGGSVFEKVILNHQHVKLSSHGGLVLHVLDRHTFSYLVAV